MATDPTRLLHPLLVVGVDGAGQHDDDHALLMLSAQLPVGLYRTES